LSANKTLSVQITVFADWQVIQNQQFCTAGGT